MKQKETLKMQKNIWGHWKNVSVIKQCVWNNVICKMLRKSIVRIYTNILCNPLQVI